MEGSTYCGRELITSVDLQTYQESSKTSNVYEVVVIEAVKIRCLLRSNIDAGVDTLIHLMIISIQTATWEDILSDTSKWREKPSNGLMEVVRLNRSKLG